MGDFKGYCLDGKRIMDLGTFLEAFRKAGLAALSRRFHTMVADEAARLVDLHRVGLGNAEADDHPLRIAAAAVRGRGFDNLDCVLELHVVGDTALVRFTRGEAIYSKAISGIAGLTEVRWPPVPGVKLSPKEIAKAEALAATTDAVGMSIRLLDWPVPKLRAAGIPNLIPDRSLRLQRTASSVLWMQSSFRKSGDNEGFRRWLREDGVKPLKATMINVDREIPISFDKDDLTRFGERRSISPVPRKKKAPIARPDTEERPVDHADVIRGNDGRTIVAVWHAGFSPRDRIMLMLYGTTLGFTQSGKDFGQIVAVPTAAVAALRSGDEIYVVEIRRHDGRNEVVGNHAAILMDMSSDDDHLSTAQHWHTRPVTSTAGTLGTKLK